MAHLTNRARKDLDRLPVRLREKAEEIIAQLDADPTSGKKLVGSLAGFWSARLGRSHRIIYKMDKMKGTSRQLAIVLTVSDRKDAYR